MSVRLDHALIFFLFLPKFPGLATIELTARLSHTVSVPIGANPRVENMNRVIRRKKGTPQRHQELDPDLLAAIEQISVLTPREQELKSLLKYLLKRDLLELNEGADLNQLAIRITPLLEGQTTASQRSRIIADWLLEQPEVEDLYISDEDLTRLVTGL